MNQEAHLWLQDNAPDFVLDCINQLQDDLVFAIKNLKMNNWNPGEDEEYEYCIECHAPDWNHKEGCSLLNFRERIVNQFNLSEYYINQ